MGPCSSRLQVVTGAGAATDGDPVECEDRQATLISVVWPFTSDRSGLENLSRVKPKNSSSGHQAAQSPPPHRDNNVAIFQLGNLLVINAAGT